MGARRYRSFVVEGRVLVASPVAPLGVALDVDSLLFGASESFLVALLDAGGGAVSVLRLFDVLSLSILSLRLMSWSKSSISTCSFASSEDARRSENRPMTTC